MRLLILVVTALFIEGCQSMSSCSDEQAITRVENCVCYRSVEGQKLEPWQLSWKKPQKLKEQFTDCSCQIHIDMKKVKDPSRFIVSGTEVK